MFSTLPRHGWFVDSKGKPCKIIRSFDDRVIYRDGERARVASIGKFNADFEPVSRSDGHPDLIVKREDMALIAVAPELLEALHSIVLNANPVLFSPGQLEQARAAITKATVTAH